MKPCCCACPTLPHGRLNNIQFMMDSSVGMVTWWPIAIGSVPTKAYPQAKSFFPKENNYLQSMAGFAPKS